MQLLCMLPRQNTCIGGNGDSDMLQENPVEWKIHPHYIFRISKAREYKLLS